MLSVCKIFVIYYYFHDILLREGLLYAHVYFCINLIHTCSKYMH